MHRANKNRDGQLWAVMALSFCLVGAMGASAQVAEVSIGDADIVWSPVVDFDKAVLTVSGPSGIMTREFAAGELPSLEVFDLTDGSYTWELRTVPVLDAADRAAMAQARANGERIALSKTGLVQSGYVSVVDGGFVFPRGGEPTNPSEGAVATKDQVILDDLIVDGSACIGMDCVNGESFGFDTLRLKENNLRIKFQDTSNSASFPSNDWQLVANDTTNGGANKFSIDDVDGGRTPFTIEASAPSHSLYVDDGGRVGLGTSTPVVELHIVNGDSPTVRLEQNGSSGFTAQTWDMAGNETNFFVRDATNGSRLPFKIRPSAPTNSLYVNTDGNIGLGTASPSEALDIERNGALEIHMRNSSTNNTWEFEHRAGGALAFNLTGANGIGVDEMAIDPGGNVTINNNLAANGSLTIGLGGTFTGAVSALSFNPTSDVNAKTAFAPVDPQRVLDTVATLPVSTWVFKVDPATRHMGPMAQDFAAAFGLGNDDRRINLTDTAGVAFAAIKALDQNVDAKQAQIEALQQENADLAARLAALEALVQSMSAGN